MNNVKKLNLVKYLKEDDSYWKNKRINDSPEPRVGRLILKQTKEDIEFN